jgi:hypothetical protein
MRELRPWLGGDDLLYALSRLAAVDKHQLVTPIAVLPQSMNVKIEPPSSRAGYVRHFSIPGATWDPDRGEATLAITDPRDGTHFAGVHIQSILSFGKVDVVSRQPVIPILRELASKVEKIIGLFESEMRRAARA